MDSSSSAPKLYRLDSRLRSAAPILHREARADARSLRIDIRRRLVEASGPMKPSSSLRRVAWLALLIIAPGVSGPGAVVATLAALASFDGDHAHYVSVQQDLGHDDFVFCHDARAGTDRFESAFAATDCADDHRLHAANTESLISRHDAAALSHDAQRALVAVLSPEIAVEPCQTLPALAPATLIARRHQSTVVLRI